MHTQKIYTFYIKNILVTFFSFHFHTSTYVCYLLFFTFTLTLTFFSYGHRASQQQQQQLPSRYYLKRLRYKNYDDSTHHPPPHHSASFLEKRLMHSYTVTMRAPFGTIPITRAVAPLVNPIIPSASYK